MKPFNAAQIKIDRAQHHLADLGTKVDAFFAEGNAYVAVELAQEFSVATGAPTAAYTYRQKAEVPEEWSAVIGDVIHNARSSLDLVACDLHRLKGGRPAHISEVYYPFCSSKQGLSEMIKKRRLSHIGQEFIDIIKKTAPYKGGNEGLRAIHDLDIMDKHKALIPAIATASLDWPVKVVDAPQRFVTGIFKDGQRLVVYPPNVFDRPLGTRIPVDFSIVFGEVGVFQGVDIRKQLTACLASIQVILDLFRLAAMDQHLI